MMYDLPFGGENIHELEIRHHNLYIRLFTLHYHRRVNVRSLAYLPPKGTHGDECHQQQSDDKDADTNRSLHHKIRRVLVDKLKNHNVL